MGEPALKNIARPVRAYRVASPASATTPETPALALPDKPSVAILPFTNMSGDPDQEFFADGIAEDIITTLSRYRSLFVIARNSSFTYKGRAVDVKDVGRTLGVRYVLEGSLRKSGNRVRITAQLVEAENGKHVWAERYDRDLADIFAVQDEIADAVTIAAAPAIDQAERQRAMRKPPESLDAWAACHRGLWHLSKISSPDNALAEEFFQRAIDLDPNFSRGYAGLAVAQHMGARLFGARDLTEAQKSCERLAQRAVTLDPADAETRACLATFLVNRGDFDGAQTEAERALAISPNLARAYEALAMTLIFGGRPKDGLAVLERSIRLDPSCPEMWSLLNLATVGLYFCGDYEAAIAAARRAIRSFPEYPTPYRWLAAALGQLGRIEEAKEALERAVALAPAPFELHVRQKVPWQRPEDYAHMLEGLRKAGWQG